MQGARGVLGYSYIATPENLRNSLLITLASYILGQLFPKISRPYPQGVPKWNLILAILQIYNPPHTLQVYYTHHFHFCQSFSCTTMSQLPKKYQKVVDKSPYRVYNRIRCTLKGHTYTSHARMPQGSSLNCIIYWEFPRNSLQI